MIFETERLIIRPWEQRDTADALEMYSHPDVLRFLPNRASESVSLESQWASLERANQRYAELNDGTGFWAVIERESGRATGASLLKALPGHPWIEIGWHQNPNFWGKGYATEAARGALQYGWENLNLDRIVAVVLPDNHKSIAVTQRLGMEPEGMVQAYDLDLNLYSLSRP